MLIRPVTESDIDAIVELSAQADFGLTTLPSNVDYLTTRIQRARRAFADIPDEPGGESYFFVLEDSISEKLLGTSGIVSRVGGFEPFYAYEVRMAVRESKKLGIKREVPVLHLSAQHDGPCEIGSLFLAPSHRRGGLGALLSQTRFLFMAEHPKAFADTVIAELRGVSDPSGTAPFWEAVGRHFFALDFPRADWLSIVDKTFIAELMPTDPVYVPLLHPDVQAVIGKVHPNTEAALHILEGQGFTRTNHVDIFDAGPVVSCPLADIRTIHDSVRATVVGLTPGENDANGTTPAIVCRPGGADFRSALGKIRKTDDGQVELSKPCADLIGVGIGDQVRYITRQNR